MNKKKTGIGAVLIAILITASSRGIITYNNYKRVQSYEKANKLSTEETNENRRYMEKKEYEENGLTYKLVIFIKKLTERDRRDLFALHKM